MRTPLFLLAVLLGLAIVVPGAVAAPAQGLIAPPSACPGSERAEARVAVQVRAMRCLTNIARARAGKPRLAPVGALDRAAGAKSADILRCDEFDHEACGREFTHWFERVGYGGRCTALGENIAWGTGRLGAARSIFSSWVRSPGHRANILGPFADLGIGLRTGRLEGNAGARVWTQSFGSRRC